MSTHKLDPRTEGRAAFVAGHGRNSDNPYARKSGSPEFRMWVIGFDEAHAAARNAQNIRMFGQRQRDEMHSRISMANAINLE